MTPEPLWRVSAYDGQPHGFYELGPDFSQALCSHSVPTSRLRDEAGETRCIACLLVFGDDLAVAKGDPGGWRD
jgi:hypothetical protein